MAGCNLIGVVRHCFWGYYRGVGSPGDLRLQTEGGTERYRFVGYLPADDFLAQLHLGLAKAAFARGQFEESRRGFETVTSQYAQTSAAPEALYWSAASAYKATGKAELLQKGGAKLSQKYPQSEWAKKGQCG